MRTFPGRQSPHELRWRRGSCAHIYPADAGAPKPQAQFNCPSIERERVNEVPYRTRDWQAVRNGVYSVTHSLSAGRASDGVMGQRAC